VIDLDLLESGVLKKKRRALAQAITLIESSHENHMQLAAKLLDRLPNKQAFTIGITGAPGVGKSTFIEGLGQEIVKKYGSLAVLTVDPSSVVTGGSILGDKTRMEELARLDNVFIRPSPSQGTLGGIAPKTKDMIALLAAAGFDTIIIESVGVGQSEINLAQIVDLCMLLIAPGGGDDLQGMKRGVVELSHMIVVNKADGDLKVLAASTASDYGFALHNRIQSSTWQVPVKLVSSLTKDGFSDIIDCIESFKRLVDVSNKPTAPSP
jgi:GTPase